jgi:hypothetical protein
VWYTNYFVWYPGRRKKIRYHLMCFLWREDARRLAWYRSIILTFPRISNWLDVFRVPRFGLWSNKCFHLLLTTWVPYEKSASSSTSCLISKVKPTVCLVYSWTVCCGTNVQFLPKQYFRPPHLLHLYINKSYL